jgi:hypothetical protein
MSVWIKASEQMPPLDEQVVILYKDKEDDLAPDKLYYAIAQRTIIKPFPSSSERYETWSRFTEYQGYYEVVYWARLYDMPRIELREVEE